MKLLPYSLLFFAALTLIFAIFGVVPASSEEVDSEDATLEFDDDDYYYSNEGKRNSLSYWLSSEAVTF